MNIERLIKTIKLDEGFSPVAYFDNEQFSYGYGCKAPYEGAIISEEKAYILLNDEVLNAMKDFMDIYSDCQDNINDVRAEALCNLVFNIGKTKLLKFRKMNKAIRSNDWTTAAYEAMNSNWYKQVGKRAVRICKELASGEKG